MVWKNPLIGVVHLGLLKKIKAEYDGLISQIPLDKLKELYFNMSYDTHKTLWIDNDEDTYLKKDKELEAFIRSLTDDQRRNMVIEEFRSDHKIILELRKVIRSQLLSKDVLMITLTHSLGYINHHIEMYRATGDESELDEIIKLVYDLQGNQEIYLKRAKDIVKYYDDYEGTMIMKAILNYCNVI